MKGSNKFWGEWIEMNQDWPEAIEFGKESLKQEKYRDVIKDG